jgi:hypothetical protein
MCFGGGGSQTAPVAPAPNVGVIDVNKVAPDPSQAYRYQGGRADPNTTGRMGGEMLIDAANKAPKTTLGGQ